MGKDARHPIVDGPLMDPCDPFWIDCQAKVRTHVRAYAQRHRLASGERDRLLDILGLA